MSLTICIPGEPVAQGRPRAAVIAGRARVFDPKKSRNWKATAREHMHAALAAEDRRFPYPEGPVRVVIVARFTCPKGDHRKTAPAPERWRAKKPDAENVAKAVLDAATGVLWQDDAQVAELTVQTITAAQGEAPGVVLTVEALPLDRSERAGNRGVWVTAEVATLVDEGMAIARKERAAKLAAEGSE